MQNDQNQTNLGPVAKAGYRQQHIKKAISYTENKCKATNKTSTINSQQESKQKGETKYGTCNPLTKWVVSDRQTGHTHADKTHTHQQQHEYAKTGLEDVMANPATIQQSGNRSKRC